MLHNVPDWFKKLGSTTRSIGYKTKTKRDLLNRVFQHFWHFACLHYDFSLVNDDVTLNSDWPLGFLWFCYLDILFKTALKSFQVMQIC